MILVLNKLLLFLLYYYFHFQGPISFSPRDMGISMKLYFQIVEYYLFSVVDLTQNDPVLVFKKFRLDKTFNKNKNKKE